MLVEKRRKEELPVGASEPPVTRCAGTDVDGGAAHDQTYKNKISVCRRKGMQRV